MVSSIYMLICRLLAASVALPVAVTARGALVPKQYNAASSCHYLPEDAGWPSTHQWQNLNQSVGGRLIPGTPLGSICYGSTANNASCAALQNDWTQESIYYSDPVAVMSPKYLNDSCSPFVTSMTPNGSACIMGNMPQYAINVSSSEDVIAGLKFAKERNIRLVVKNTGHDYQGRSCGQGSLSLWTHNLKDISFLNYTSDSYTGPAIRLGAGVQAFEAYKAVGSKNLRITAGLCPTVGIAGGYVASGGHGPLMGTYGLAADNSLEFEVVTPDRGYMIASATQNADLFWALNGGGGGAYAVVISQTTRVHQDGPVVAAELAFNNTDDTSYWAAVDAWHNLLPAINSIPGAACTFSLTGSSVQALLTVLDGNATTVSNTIAPFLAQLDNLNVPHSNLLINQSNFYDYISTVESNLLNGDFPTNELAGGRIIPLSVVSTENQRADLVAALRTIVSSETSKFVINGNAANLSVSHTGLDNAILPAWRTMAYTLQINAYPDPAASVDVLDQVNTEVITGQDVLRDLTPGSGTYVNEATFDPTHWKDDYYGINYDKLLSVKNKYDSDVILYGPAVVGNDYWTVASDGRLCRA